MEFGEVMCVGLEGVRGLHKLYFQNAKRHTNKPPRFAIFEFLEELEKFENVF